MNMMQLEQCINDYGTDIYTFCRQITCSWQDNSVYESKLTNPIFQINESKLKKQIFRSKIKSRYFEPTKQNKKQVFQTNEPK